MTIPFVDLRAQYLNIKPEIDATIQNVIDETAFIGGKYVQEFEKQFADMYGVEHCISCANGTDSLYIIMKMLGITNGDEVITAANSWISSSETITQTGATPVFADVDEYYTINPKDLESKITANTKAVIVVHLYGQICDMDAIEGICNKHGIFLIEDCAQSHFSEYKGVKAGLRGIAGSFSFYPGKNLGAYGDAGCIISNDEELSIKCKMYARHGALKKHEHVMEGINSRMDGLQAAILLTKLPHILMWTQQRIQVADKYNQLLSGISQIQLPMQRPDTKHTYHLFVIKAQRRDELAAYLKNAGVDTAIHYPTAIPLLPAYKQYQYSESSFSVSKYNSTCILSLPIFPEIKTEQLEYIAAKIKEFYNF